MTPVVLFLHGPKSDFVVPIFKQELATLRVPVNPPPMPSAKQNVDGSWTWEMTDAGVAYKTIALDEGEIPSLSIFSAKEAWSAAKTKVVIVTDFDDLKLRKTDTQAVVLLKDRPTEADTADYMTWDHIIATESFDTAVVGVRDLVRKVRSILLVA